MMNSDRKWWIIVGVAGGCAMLVVLTGIVALGAAFVFSRQRSQDTRALSSTEGGSQDEASEEAAPSTDSGPMKQGDRVDYPGREGHATIEQIAADGIHIRLDGCQPYLAKDVVHESDLRRATSLSRKAAAVRALVGSWSMFEPGTFNTTTRGDEVFRVWGMGGKAPPLTIDADGSYVWIEDSQHTARGEWRPDARVVGLPPKGSPSMEGNAYHDGIVLRDAEGNEWKVYRTVIEGKKEESIAVAQVCQEAHSFMGTRIR